MTLVVDAQRALIAGSRLFEAFEGGGPGIFGTKEMPENLLPRNVEQGSEEHLRFITFTVSIDYMRDAADLWRASREAFENQATTFLFDPEAIQAMETEELQGWLTRLSISRKHDPDATTWQTVGTVLTLHYGGTVRGLIENCNSSAPELLTSIRRAPTRIRFLSGPKIGPLWCRMLRDNCGVALENMEQLPIPVDVHIARATLAIGAVQCDAPVSEAHLFQEIRAVWAKACDGTIYYPLQFDRALWQQSRLGCTNRSEDACPKMDECLVGDMCVKGRIAFGQNGTIDLETLPLRAMRN